MDVRKYSISYLYRISVRVSVKNLFIILLIVTVGSVATSAVYAVENFTGTVTTDGDMLVTNGGKLSIIGNGLASNGINIESPTTQNFIKFKNTATGSIYKFRQVGDNFQLYNQIEKTKDLVVVGGSGVGAGNVGIGTSLPTEKLDVTGNIKLSGNILSNGDICIGNCP